MVRRVSRDRSCREAVNAENPAVTHAEKFHGSYHHTKGRASSAIKARGGCSVRKCFGVRESRPYSGRRSPKSCRFFLLFTWQKLFFHDFSPTAPTLRGFVA